MADLFISYAKPDRSLAMELADELRERGFSVWIDQSGIGGAKNWTAEIVEGINGCSTLIVLLSPDSVASHNVAKEVQLASEKRKNILPVIVEQVTLPAIFEYPLVGIQHVHYHDRSAILHALELLKGTLSGADIPRGADVPSAVGQPSPADRAADRAIRVAVLPFDDLSPKHDNQWFADGMMDELIATLGHLDHIKVPGRSDVLHYREHRSKGSQIARELGVRYLIEGGVRKAGKKIRINASLIDSQQTEQLWANQFDGTFDDVFAFQESVSRHITEALKLQLTPREEEQIETRPTENAEAYELYLKGRHEQYYLTKESYERALELYEQAAALDPKFDRAFIGIASVCCVYYREYSRNPRWLLRAEASLATVESISGEISMTLYIRGMIDWLKGENQEAATILTRAVELDTKNHNAYNVLGMVHMECDNHSEAVNAFQRVVDITENTMSYYNLLIALHRNEESVRLARTANQALPLFERYLLREPRDYNASVSEGHVLFWAGKKEEASLVAEGLLMRSDLSGHALYSLGCLFDNLGKPEIYIDLLEKAIARGYRDLEHPRTYSFITEDSACKRRLESLVQELEGIVEREIEA